MTVVTGWFCGARQGGVPEVPQLPPQVVHALKVNVAMTSKVRRAFAWVGVWGPLPPVARSLWRRARAARR